MQKIAKNLVLALTIIMLMVSPRILHGQQQGRFENKTNVTDTNFYYGQDLDLDLYLEDEGTYVITLINEVDSISLEVNGDTTEKNRTIDFTQLLEDEYNFTGLPFIGTNILKLKDRNGVVLDEIGEFTVLKGNVEITYPINNSVYLENEFIINFTFSNIYRSIDILVISTHTGHIDTLYSGLVDDDISLPHEFINWELFTENRTFEIEVKETNDENTQGYNNIRFFLSEPIFVNLGSISGLEFKTNDDSDTVYLSEPFVVNWINSSHLVEVEVYLHNLRNDDYTSLGLVTPGNVNQYNITLSDPQHNGNSYEIVFAYLNPYNNNIHRIAETPSFVASSTKAGLFLNDLDDEYVTDRNFNISWDKIGIGNNLVLNIYLIIDGTKIHITHPDRPVLAKFGSAQIDAEYLDEGEAYIEITTTISDTEEKLLATSNNFNLVGVYCQDYLDLILDYVDAVEDLKSDTTRLNEVIDGLVKDTTDLRMEIVKLNLQLSNKDTLIIVYAINTEGIEEERYRENISDVSIFNTLDGVLVIIGENIIDTEIHIWDITGKELIIAENNISRAQNTASIILEETNFPNGTYFIGLEDDRKVTFRKFQVVR